MPNIIFELPERFQNKNYVEKVEVAVIDCDMNKVSVVHVGTNSKLLTTLYHSLCRFFRETGLDKKYQVVMLKH